MRKIVILAFATILPGAALFALFWPIGQKEDDIVIALRDESFFPIKPPSKTNTVGAIYYVEPGEGRVTRLCSPNDEISGDIVRKSPSADVQGTYISEIAYVSDGSLSQGALAKASGAVSDRSKIKLSFKLTDVLIDEIDLDSSKHLLDVLMNRKDCVDIVTQYWRLGGYICQDTQLLAATAIFDSKGGSDVVVRLDQESQKVLASKIEAATGARLDSEEGRSTSGQRLQWGMKMPPLCISPPWARFPRTFPRNVFERVVNYLKFNVLEPLLPAST